MTSEDTILPDEDQEPPDTLLLDNFLKENIEAILNTLDKREREFIKLYFGLDGPEMTLEEIGSRFGLTRERIRQIKRRALNKMRHPGRAQKLMPYAEKIYTGHSSSR